MDEIRDTIGPNKDIPEPDMGTDSQTMSWIIDAYSRQEAETILDVVTGKPVIGAVWARGTPGRSVALTDRKASDYDDDPLEETTVAV